ncbi:PAS fold protein (plasmid) [Martelella mediterranea DSM 17316]|uniref:PAS fold protein n=1 Tax=Martelella mediterranea DSM 17316 TaxID=1122214 RepID=A0A1U9Z9X8_9HYPH|nr:PAS fold protein [Martelella mediterranea DSM 17316]
MQSLENGLLEGVETAISAHLSATSVLERLPVGAYVCASDGRIIRYNAAAADLWGRTPIPDAEERFCGSHRLFDLNDRHVPHAACPMAVALATGRDFRDQPIKIERPDGSRITALVDIQPFRDDSGAVAGAVNIFRQSEPPAQVPSRNFPAMYRSFRRCRLCQRRSTSPTPTVRSRFTTKRRPKCGAPVPKLAAANSAVHGSFFVRTARHCRMISAPWRSH